MPENINKNQYLKEISKAGSRPETKNQAVIAEILVDLLDHMHDILDALKDIKEVLEGS